MSEEDQELLARIGELAGQINRHKNQQASRHHPYNQGVAPRRPNPYGHRGASYAPRGFRGRQAPTTHRHRTLHLNSSGSTPDGTPPPSNPTTDGTSWVSKTDRHRQLINANVYDKEVRNRTKAIEETRQRKLRGRRDGEKRQLLEYLKGVNSAGVAGGGTSNSTEVLINGIRFRVLDGGKKLARLPNDPNSASATPRATTIAGVRFNRTKTGNLIANRIVRSHRASGKVRKLDELCKTFTLSGSCPKGPLCRYQHDPNKVALCKAFLKDGRCVHGDSCDLSHDMTPERVPNCVHFAKGSCTKPDCPYTHSRAEATAPVCESFGFQGYCEKGAECTSRHVFECPNFSNTGTCKIKGCKLPHRERASVLRNMAKLDEANADMEDLSSDDDATGDSDDVDSDEVAEFLEADSDESDGEEKPEFISL